MVQFSSITKKIMFWVMMSSLVMPSSSDAMNNFDSKLTVPFLGAFAGAFAACFIGQYIWQKNTIQIAHERKEIKNDRNVQKSSDSFNSLLEQMNMHKDKPKNFFTGYYLGDIGSLQAKTSRDLNLTFDIQKQEIIFDSTNNSYIISPDYQSYVINPDQSLIKGRKKVLAFGSSNRGTSFSRFISYDMDTNNLNTIGNFHTGEGLKKYFCIRKLQE